MSDELDSKVIHIFERHKKGDHFHFEVEEGGELVISPDGLNYVTFKYFPPEAVTLEEQAKQHFASKFYLVKMLESHKQSGVTRINHYHVSGEQLESFLKSLDKRPGTLIGVESYLPNTTA
ncbi:MAG: hypothetical protein K2X01_03840 [Cyanobacteria bacterium]|nr:hypothetical protein [Cyanobacteriota bacterium]